MTAASSSRGKGRNTLQYIPALDGIRGLALVAVLTFHGGFSWASGGFLGVSTFFTLSGFLITSLLILEQENSGRIRLLAFWDRRFRRLMPASLVALAGIALYGVTLADADQLWRLRGDAFSAIAYVANWRFLSTGQNYEALFAAPSPVQHFWSIAIEEQYYLVFPLVVVALFALRRGRMPLVWAFALAATASVIWMALCLEPGGSISRAYYGTDTRAFELLAGALLATDWHGRGGPKRDRSRRALQIAGITGLTVSIGAWTSATLEWRGLFCGGFAAFSLASVAMIAAVLQPGPLSRFLSWAPLRGLGRISYGAYLYHWPIYLSLDADHSGIDGAPLFALRVGATLAAATVSFRWIERPVRLGRLRQDRRVWFGVPFAVASVAALHFGVTRNLEAPWYAKEGSKKIVSHEVGEVDRDHKVRDGARDASAEEPRGRRTRMWVVGDSVGYTIGRGLRAWGRETRSLFVRNHAKIGCSFARGGLVRIRSGAIERPARCQVWEELWPPRIAKFQPEIAVVMTGVWDLIDRKLPEWPAYRSIGDAAFDDYLMDEYLRVVDILSAHGALVVWLNQPCIHPDPPQNIQIGPLGGTPALSQERIDRFNRELLPRLAAARPERLRLVDFDAYMCPGGRFPPPNSPLANARVDGVHFEDDEALELAEWLAPLLLELRDRSTEAAR